MNYSTHFFIKPYKLTENKLAPVYLRIVLNGIKMEQSTGQKIKLQQWDNRQQKVIQHPDAYTLNQLLETLKNKYDKAYAQLYIAQEDITPEKLKALVNRKERNPQQLLTVMQEHNQAFEKQVGSRYSYGSFKNYKTTYHYLKEFIQRQYKKHDLPLREINYRFCDLFYQFLLTEKPCKNNGACKHIQRLKKIIHYAVKSGYLTHSSLGRFSVKMNPYQRPKLSMEAVQQLQQLKLNNATLKKVRDVFLFQCYTGLAYADLKKINSSHIVTGIDKKAWIHMQRTKTKQVFTVPLLKPALKILREYEQHSTPGSPLFPVLSNQKMNSYLKVLGEIAEIPIPLTSHLARHTFASTITLQEGVPIETVSRMLGHSNLRTTQLYATVTELKISRDMKGVESKHQ